MKVKHDQLQVILFSYILETAKPDYRVLWLLLRGRRVINMAPGDIIYCLLLPSSALALAGLSLALILHFSSPPPHPRKSSSSAGSDHRLHSNIVMSQE